MSHPNGSTSSTGTSTAATPAARGDGADSAEPANRPARKEPPDGTDPHNQTVLLGRPRCRIATQRGSSHADRNDQLRRRRRLFSGLGNSARRVHLPARRNATDNHSEMARRDSEGGNHRGLRSRRTRIRTVPQLGEPPAHQPSHGIGHTEGSDRVITLEPLQSQSGAAPDYARAARGTHVGKGRGREGKGSTWVTPGAPVPLVCTHPPVVTPSSIHPWVTREANQ